MFKCVFNLQREDNLPIKDKMAGPNVSIILRFHCIPCLKLVAWIPHYLLVTAFQVLIVLKCHGIPKVEACYSQCPRIRLKHTIHHYILGEHEACYSPYRCVSSCHV